MSRSPNNRPFQRPRFAELFAAKPELHIFRRELMEPYFKRVNPEGWRHDLGAQDVFLDNLGVVLAEQLSDPGRRHAYLRSFLEGQCLPRWSVLRGMVLPRSPWWGENFNAKQRRAATGEPRGLLRFWPENDQILEVLRDLGVAVPESTDGTGEGRDLDLWSLLFPSTVERDAPVFPDFRGWADEAERLLWPPGTLEPYSQDDATWQPTLGVIIPAGLKPRKAAWLLPVTQATPDLPARCGVEETDWAIYREALNGRDQERLPTCVSFAVAMACDVLVRRHPGVRFHQFSPAFLHLASGPETLDGRSLDAVLEVLRRGLPCDERRLPYVDLISGKAQQSALRRDEVRADVDSFRRQFGTPIVHRLPVDEIAKIKAYLAAGWVVVVTTWVGEQFQRRGILRLGLPLLPLPWEEQLGQHAWALVGYDSVDGALGWKYQGRFLALSSWGAWVGERSVFPAGTLTLPFSFIYNRGVQAVAIRLPGLR